MAGVRTAVRGVGYFAEPKLTARARAAVEVQARLLSADDSLLRYIVIGHHHVALDEPINDHCRLVILGNWINRSTYAVFEKQ